MDSWVALQVSPITKFCPVYTILNKLMPETDPIQTTRILDFF